ncbi:MAG: bacillithiol system redox-active protein YtxJ [Bacteroidetes bacterium]|nr:bacillithiol system redox-active protein YtxJ [Bacteroidota bacterium]
MDFFDFSPSISLEDIEKRSEKRRQIILKHSTRCIISSMALRNLTQCDAEADCWVLDLLNHRELSNEISVRYQITHQSPQIILLHHGEVQLSASHEQITCELLTKDYGQ